MISPKKTGMATTKKDARDHGLGIGIIRSIVSKYNGTLKMNDCGDHFEIEALLFTRKARRRGKQKPSQ